MSYYSHLRVCFFRVHDNTLKIHLKWNNYLGGPPTSIHCESTFHKYWESSTLSTTTNICMGVFSHVEENVVETNLLNTNFMIMNMDHETLYIGQSMSIVWKGLDGITIPCTSKASKASDVMITKKTVIVLNESKTRLTNKVIEIFKSSYLFKLIPLQIFVFIPLRVITSFNFVYLAL